MSQALSNKIVVGKTLILDTLNQRRFRVTRKYETGIGLEDVDDRRKLASFTWINLEYGINSGRLVLTNGYFGLIGNRISSRLLGILRFISRKI